MHPNRKKRVLEELKDATPLKMSVKFGIEIGGGIITNTLTLSDMPALVFESENEQVIKCLPLNHLGSGKTDKEAFMRFGEDIAEMIFEAFVESNFIEHLISLFEGPAAKIYWTEHKKLTKKKRPDKVKIKEDIKRKIDNIELETVMPEIDDTEIYQKKLETAYQESAEFAH